VARFSIMGGLSCGLSGYAGAFPGVLQESVQEIHA